MNTQPIGYASSQRSAVLCRVRVQVTCLNLVIYVGAGEHYRDAWR
jgi:hypothetical protein